METVTLKGTAFHISGNLPAVGSQAPDFVLTKTDLSDLSLKDFKGKKLVLNIFPSIDTPVCATSVRKFNEKAAVLGNVTVLCISADMPFAHARFCGAEGIKNVVSVSDLRNKDFGEKYGVRAVDGPLKGLLARAIVVIDANGKVVHTELVPEIAQEPNYEKALSAAR